jgi:hypothetical protein
MFRQREPAQRLTKTFDKSYVGMASPKGILAVRLRRRDVVHCHIAPLHRAPLRPKRR